MRLVVIIILLSLGYLVQAQDKKNEVQIGLPGAYFFDKSPFRFHRLETLPILPKVRYSRAFNSSYGASVDYSYVWLVFHPNFKKLFYEGEIIQRDFHTIQLSLTSNKVIYGNIKFIALFGLSYRFLGGEMVHLGYHYTSNGIPWEAIWDFREYSDFGINFGTQAQLRFLKNFNLAAEVGFTRYFTKVSPNQLNTAVLVGFRF